MIRSELVTAVRDYLNRPNLSATTVGIWITMAEGILNRALREHSRNQVTATFTPAIDSTTIPLPEDMLQLLELRYKDLVLTQYMPTEREVAMEDPAGFIIVGQAIQLSATVTEPDMEYTMDYVAALKPLVYDEDNNWVSRVFPDVYLYATLAEAAVWLKDDARIAAMTTLRDGRLDAVAAEGWGRTISAVPVVRPAYTD